MMSKILPILLAIICLKADSYWSKIWGYTIGGNEINFKQLEASICEFHSAVYVSKFIFSYLLEKKGFKKCDVDWYLGWKLEKM